MRAATKDCRIDIEFDAKQRRFEVAFLGLVAIADRLKMIEEILNHPDFGAEQTILVDFRDAHIAEWSEGSLTELRKLAEISAGLQANPIAFVLPSKSDFGRTRQIIAYAEHEPALNLRLFLRRVDAMEWLGGMA